MALSHPVHNVSDFNKEKERENRVEGRRGGGEEGMVRLLTCVIVAASEPSLSSELATALYCTVNKREEEEKKRREGEREVHTWANAVVSISWCISDPYC